jgi:hypothetical protein
LKISSSELTHIISAKNRSDISLVIRPDDPPTVVIEYLSNSFLKLTMLKKLASGINYKSSFVLYKRQLCTVLEVGLLPRGWVS